MESSYMIAFEEVSDKEATKCARELKEALLDISPIMNIEQNPTSDRSQDMGATLALILGSSAAVALAKGIAKAIVEVATRRAVTKVVITAPDGKKVEVSNVRTKDALPIIEQIFKQS